MKEMQEHHQQQQQWHELELQRGSSTSYWRSLYFLHGPRAGDIVSVPLVCCVLLAWRSGIQYPGGEARRRFTAPPRTGRFST
jgi:hypothetical protein